MAEPIEILEYNAEWPAMYEAEKARILGAAGAKIVAIEHIGSTAVPGLGAKPIIDVLAAVEQMSDSLACIEPLKNLGYEYYFWPEFPERCLFLDGPIGAGPHHLHMTGSMSDFWREKLLFRDFLRAHSEVAEEYYELKKAWAATYGADSDRYEPYTEAKNGFIDSLLRRARLQV